MTYKQFIEDMREQADILEKMVNRSQVITQRDQIVEEDTFLNAYIDGVEELMDNATGVHGHTVEVRR